MCIRDRLLYSDARINIWKKNRDIYLGPVVGVFVNNRYLEDIEKGCPPVSAQKHMQANEKACCLTYYFSIERINWVDNWIKGYTYIPVSYTHLVDAGRLVYSAVSGSGEGSWLRRCRASTR